MAWSIPLIIAEYALGQRGRKGVVGTFAELDQGPRFAWMGAFVAFVAAAIMCYYSVVAGWCLYYTGGALVYRPPAQRSTSAQASWDGFQASGLPVLFHAAHGRDWARSRAVFRGVSSPSSAPTKCSCPTLLVIVVDRRRSGPSRCPAPGAGIAYLFTPDWSVLAEPATSGSRR